jgi:advillin
VQVRVVQGKEPNHFLTLFKGRMIVHQGGVASGFKNKKDKDSFDTDGISLFHIKGTTPLNTRAVQVEEKAGSLNSGDCFALLTPGSVFIWKGKGANAEEKKVAANITAIIQGDRKVVQVDEGKEPGPFWEALGGQGEYANAKDLGDDAKEPRLFQLSTAGDGFTVTEVFNFTQDDLIKDDVMLLDTFTEVFVWLGSDCTREEKDLSIKTALDYVQNSPDGRSKDTPVFKVFAGAEPPNFTAHFLGWDYKKASDFSDQYLKALSALKSSGQATSRATADDMGYKPYSTVVSLDDLKANKVANIDPSRKELYLSDEVFKKLFGCTKKEWEPKPAWKRNAEKKKHGLF